MKVSRKAVSAEQQLRNSAVRPIHGRKAAKHHYFNHTIGTLAVLSAIFILVGVIFNGSLASAHEEQETTMIGSTCYKSILIEKGDTLWNLAEEYMTDDYSSVQEYVQDLKRMNRLKDDKIISGEYLIVAYEFAG